MPEIKITILGVDKKLSENVQNSITNQSGYKYTYLKQLVARVRMVVSHNTNLPEEEQIKILTNVLITERNIANFSAERYAELNEEDLFNSFMEIVEEIEELFK